jgi:hypothetical protein
MSPNNPKDDMVRVTIENRKNKRFMDSQKEIALSKKNSSLKSLNSKGSLGRTVSSSLVAILRAFCSFPGVNLMVSSFEPESAFGSRNIT